MRNRKVLILCASFLVVGLIGIISVILVLRRSGNKYVDGIRAEAFSTVKKLASDEKWIKDNLGKGKEKWLSDHMIAMRNGEWMIYYYRTSKQDTDCCGGYDIFVGKGSDGKWYVTKYHFCLHMFVVDFTGQPFDLATFRQEYELIEIPEPK